MLAQVGTHTVSALAASPPLHHRFPNVSSIAFTTFFSTLIRPDPKVTDELFSSFIFLDVRHMSNLKSLDLRTARHLTFASIVALCRYCTRLESLMLPLCMSEAHALGPLAALPRLQRLCIDELPSNATSLADLARLTGLTGLSWWRSGHDYGEPDPMTVPSTLVRLRYLRIEKLLNGMGDDVIRFADTARLPCLNHLRLRFLTSHCSQLAASASLSTICCDRLDLFPRDEEGHEITDAADLHVKPVASVTRVSIRTHSVPKEQLELCLRLFPNLSALTCTVGADECIKLLADRVPGLRGLTLNRYSRLTAAGLQHIAKLTALERLCLSVEGLSDWDVLCLVDAGPLSLRRIELRVHGDGVSDATGAILARLPALTEIVFLGCRRVTQTGVAMLIDSAPVLLRVAIRNCGTDAAGIDLCRQRAAAAGKRVQIVYLVDDQAEDDPTHPFPKTMAD